MFPNDCRVLEFSAKTPRLAGGEGRIRTHGTVTRTTVFETTPSQIGIGGSVNSRWLQAPATTFTERVNLSSRLAFFALDPRPSSTILAISPTISISRPLSAGLI